MKGSNLRLKVVVLVAVVTYVCSSADARESIYSPVLAYPPSQVVYSFPVNRLAADSLRSRVYATVPGTNSVVVFDTTTLSVIKTIWVGSDPFTLSISADRATLWVTNSGSSTSAIRGLDLDLLALLPPISAPETPYDVKEGLDGRLYVAPSFDESSSPGLFQIDSDSGAVEKKFSGAYSASYVRLLLEISGDRKTLLTSGTGSSAPTGLQRFNVASSTPSFVESLSVTTLASGPRANHTGDSFALPLGTGSPAYSTTLVPFSSLKMINRIFQIGSPYLGPVAFSNDDHFLYEAHSLTSGSNEIVVFDTCTGGSVGTIPLDGQDPVTDMVVDRTGEWLFVATTSTSVYDIAGEVRAISTGRSDPRKPLASSVVSRKTHGSAGSWDIALSGPCGSTTEPRIEPNGAHHVIFTFQTPVSVTGVSVTPREGASGEIDGPVVANSDNTQFTVNLRNVSDRQSITVSLLGVNDAGLIGDVSVVLNVLAGDTNGDGVVNSGDSSQTRAASGQTAGTSTFRLDINLDGVVNSADASSVRNHSGNAL